MRDIATVGDMSIAMRGQMPAMPQGQAMPMGAPV
jgi:hypothetical protein